MIMEVSGKRNLISTKNVSILLLVIGLALLAFFSMNVATSSDTDIINIVRNQAYLLAAIGILLSGILVILLSLVRFLERVG